MFKDDKGEPLNKKFNVGGMELELEEGKMTNLTDYSSRIYKSVKLLLKKCKTFSLERQLNVFKSRIHRTD